MSIGVNADGKQTWIADLCAASSSDVAIFCFTQGVMMYFFRVYRFQTIPQHVLLFNLVTSKWHRILKIWLFIGKMDACVCWKHLNKPTCIVVCQNLGLRRQGVLVYITYCVNDNTVSCFLHVCIGYILNKLDAKYYYNVTSNKYFINKDYECDSPCIPILLNGKCDFDE